MISLSDIPAPLSQDLLTLSLRVLSLLPSSYSTVWKKNISVLISQIEIADRDLRLSLSH